MNKRTLFLGLLLLIAGSPTEAGAAPMSPASPVTPAEAAIASTAFGQDFVGRECSENLRHGRPTISVTGPLGTMDIDQETGLPVELYANAIAHVGITGPPKLTADEAFARAAAFLRQIGVQPDGLWTLMYSEFHDPGVGFRRYDVGLRKVFHGIGLASWISILVDADDGRILAYVLVDDPVTVPLQVNLTGEQAVGLVAQKKGWAHPVVRKADVIVSDRGSGIDPQAVLWMLEIANPDARTGADSYVWAWVNAATGEIVRLDAPGGFFVVKGKNAVSIALPKPDVKAARKDKLPPTVFELARHRKPGKQRLGK